MPMVHTLEDDEVRSLQKQLRNQIAQAIAELANASASGVPVGSLLQAQKSVNAAVAAAIALQPGEANLHLGGLH